MRIWLTLTAAVFLSACASTNPGPAADIRYHLPRTDAKATLTLTLRNCNDLSVDAELKIAAVSGAQDEEIVLPGLALASARIKRSLKVEKNDEQVIIGVNSTNSERTTQTIANYIQALEKLLPAVRVKPPPNTPLTCSETVRIAVDRADAIRKKINDLRSDKTSQHGKQIEALAKELGALDSIVRIDVSAILVMETANLGSKGRQKQAMLGSGSFIPWFGPNAIDSPELSNKFGLTWWAEIQKEKEVPVRGSNTSKASRACGLAMPIPAPVTVAVNVTGLGSQIQRLEASESMPAAQLSPPRELCLDVGIGETRTIALTLDKYGRTTAYSWESEATAETISQAVAGSASGLATIVQTARGKSDLDRKKREIDELETEQKLQKLRACKAMMEAGVPCE